MSTLAIRTLRRQAKANTRIIARNLRTAVRKNGVTVNDLRAIERRYYLPAGRLFLALTGMKISVSSMLVLHTELGMAVSDVFAGTRTMDAAV